MTKQSGSPPWLSGLPGVYDTPSHTPRAHQLTESSSLMGRREESKTKKAAEYTGRTTFRVQLVAEAKAFFLDTKLNLLLIAFPFAIISKAAGWGDGTTFTFSMLALCPLAERLGFITEQLAMYTNDTLGGLLNASFGNATEVIISGFALKAGLVRVVQLSLLGSVVSNLLLVMGTAFLAGGMRHSQQKFNQQGASVNSALLLLGTVAVLLPSLLSETKSEVTENVSELFLSRFESLFLLILYACYLLFQLYTHRFLYEEGDDKDKASQGAPEAEAVAGSSATVVDMEAGTGGGGASGTVGPSTAMHRATSRSGVELTVRTTPANTTAAYGNNTVSSAPVNNSRSNSGRPDANGRASITGSETPRAEALRDGLVAKDVGEGGAGKKGDDSDSDDSDEEEELVLSKVGCFLWLTAVTACISLLSEWIVSAIEGASKALHMPMPFLTTILLPIVGNAAEHASAIVFAWKNKIEIALGVAVGSSTQVAVLVIPFCVVLAWCMGQPLDLNFNAFEASVYFISVLLAIITLQDGTANWLKGALLLVTYVLVAAGCWLHKDYALADENPDTLKLRLS